MDSKNKTLMSIYINSYNPKCFKLISERGSDVYFSKTINSWGNYRLKLISQNLELKGKQELLTQFVNSLKGLMNNLVRLYSSVNNRKNDIAISSDQYRLVNSLELLGSFDRSIRLNAVKGDKRIAGQLIKYCTLIIDDCIDIIRGELCIDLLASPLNININQNRQRIINSLKLNKPEPKNKNPYPLIFSNGQSYLVYKKYYNALKNSNVIRADFSYFFFAMQKDKLIICKNVDFIKFLSKEYDISLDKVDNRMCGVNKRTRLYQAIKGGIIKKPHKSPKLRPTKT